MPARTPAELHPLVQEAFNRGDADALTDLYEPQAVLVINGQNTIGRNNIRNAYASILSRSGRMTLETRLIVESQQGLAVLHGKWIIEYPSEPAITSGLSTEVVRKQPDGTWLFAIDNPHTPV